MDTVSGKKILITGAAMGMGRIYAQLAVAENAAAVVLWDVDEAALNETVAELTAKGGKVHPYVVDVSKLESITAAAAKVKAEIGDVDILFNNAGVVRGKYFWEHEAAADIWLTMSINALAPMYIAREFLPAMIAGRRESRIVNIASAAGTISVPRASVYCASKSSALGWSDTVRLELLQAGHDHVKVTTVCPSYITTGMFEGAKGPLLTPLMTPEYVVNKVWASMKTGKAMLLMPWTVHLSKVMRGILPIKLWDFVADKIFGVYHTMARFTGRQAAVK